MRGNGPSQSHGLEPSFADLSPRGSPLHYFILLAYPYDLFFPPFPISPSRLLIIGPEDCIIPPIVLYFSFILIAASQVESAREWTHPMYQLRWQVPSVFRTSRQRFKPSKSHGKWGGTDFSIWMGTDRDFVDPLTMQC
jgi:hypothetical protein